MRVASACNRIMYECGCIAEWQMIGIFAHIPEWHIIPCFEHASVREEIESAAEEDWERITSEVRK